MLATVFSFTVEQLNRSGSVGYKGPSNHSLEAWGVGISEATVTDVESLPVRVPVVAIGDGEVHFKAGSGVDHQVVHCQLPDRLELEGGDGLAQAATALLEAVRVDVTHSHVLRLLLLLHSWSSGVDIHQKGLDKVFRVGSILWNLNGGLR